jgi:hypothetical protein
MARTTSTPTEAPASPVPAQRRTGPALNRVQLIGRLAADPEVRFTSSGLAAPSSADGTARTTRDDILTRLEEGIAALTSSDRWLGWLRAHSRFHTYSTGAVGVFELRECLSVEMGPVSAATRDLPTGGQ